MEFRDFIKSRWEAFNQLLLSRDSVHIVLGTDACDLDSAVSSLGYAFLLAKSEAFEAFPVLNIPRGDYPLKTEVTYLLDQYDIVSSDLIFLDEFDMDALQGEGRLCLHLVDHNSPTQRHANRTDCVVSVLDHHKQEAEFSNDVFVRIEPVGSCASLVADLMFDRLAETDLDTSVLKLFRATILCDTICFSEEAGKTTDLDIAIVDRIEQFCGLDAFSRHSVFLAIQKEKENVSGLANEELLRKDLKMVVGPQYRVAMSSMNIHIKTFLRRDSMLMAFPQFLIDHSADALIVICNGEQDGLRQKHLLVFSRCVAVYKPLLQQLRDDGSLSLVKDESIMAESVEDISIFHMSDYKVSRKQILPCVKNLLLNIVPPIATSKKNRSFLEPTADMFVMELSQPGTPGVLDSPAEIGSDTEAPHTPQLYRPADVPPNSYIEPSLLEQRHLPSFNSSEMVKRIMYKKLMLEEAAGDEGMQMDEADSATPSVPFTPVNSFVDSYLQGADLCLPTFNSREMVRKIMAKKLPLEPSEGEGDTLPLSVNPYTPQNSTCEDDTNEEVLRLDHLHAEVLRRITSASSAEDEEGLLEQQSSSDCGADELARLQKATSLVAEVIERALQTVHHDTAAGTEECK